MIRGCGVYLKKVVPIWETSAKIERYIYTIYRALFLALAYHKSYNV